MILERLDVRIKIAVFVVIMVALSMCAVLMAILVWGILFLLETVFLMVVFLGL